MGPEHVRRLPILPIDLAARLHEARRTANTSITVATSNARIHPVIALWHISLRGDLRAALAQGIRKAGAFVERYNFATAQWPTAPFDPFFNVNTPADLLEAERLAAVADHA